MRAVEFPTQDAWEVELDCGRDCFRLASATSHLPFTPLYAQETR